MGPYPPPSQGKSGPVGRKNRGSFLRPARVSPRWPGGGSGRPAVDPWGASENLRSGPAASLRRRLGRAKPLADRQKAAIPRRLRWMGGRAVEGARLESVYTSKGYRGFESHPIRHCPRRQCSQAQPCFTLAMRFSKPPGEGSEAKRPYPASRSAYAALFLGPSGCPDPPRVHWQRCEATAPGRQAASRPDAPLSGDGPPRHANHLPPAKARIPWGFPELAEETQQQNSQ